MNKKDLGVLPHIFIGRSVFEKAFEDLKILKIWQRRIENFIDVPNLNSSCVIAKFYASQIRALVKLLGIFINSLEEKFKKVYQKENFFPYWDESWIFNHQSIIELMQYYAHLDRALRHRATLFTDRMEIMRPAHYPFETIGPLLSCDAIIWESIEKSILCKKIFLLSYFSEEESITESPLIITPETLLSEEMLKEYVENIRSNKIKTIGFISVPRHTSMHSRTLVFNVHEAMHNIIYSLCNSKFFRKHWFLSFFEAICEDFDKFKIKFGNFAEYIKPVGHMAEIMCDLLTTDLTGFSYPIAGIASDLYRLHYLPMFKEHPPDYIRHYICLEYALRYLNLDIESEKIKNCINGLHTLTGQCSIKTVYGRRYLQFISSKLNEIHEIIRKVIKDPYNQYELDNSLNVKKDLDQLDENPKNSYTNIISKVEDGECSPITLLNAIWLRRLESSRLTELKENLLIPDKKHHLEIFLAMINWLEQTIPVQ